MQLERISQLWDHSVSAFWQDEMSNNVYKWIGKDFLFKNGEGDFEVFLRVGKYITT